MQYFKTFFGGKQNLAKNWFHSSIARLFYRKLLPNRKDQFQTYTLDIVAIKIEKKRISNQRHDQTAKKSAAGQPHVRFSYFGTQVEYSQALS
jgi:hypothetical protein